MDTAGGAIARISNSQTSMVRLMPCKEHTKSDVVMQRILKTDRLTLFPAWQAVKDGKVLDGGATGVVVDAGALPPTDGDSSAGFTLLDPGDVNAVTGIVPHGALFDAPPTAW